MLRNALPLILIVLLPPQILPAQEARYELGRRVRAFEREWDRRTDPEARRAASTHLANAVQAFFRFRLAEAGRELTEARFALDPAREPTTAHRWAESLLVRPEARLMASDGESLAVTIDAFYPNGAPPDGSETALTLRTSDGMSIGTTTAELDVLPTDLRLPLVDLPAGDHTLRVEIRVQGQVVAIHEVGVSIVDRPAERLDLAARRIGEWPTEPERETTETATARGLLAQLRDLKGGGIPETDLPADARLTQLEGLVEAVDAGRPGPNPDGDRWIVLATATGRTIPARLFAPAAGPNEARPLVVALHGSGGSENLFFEGYGDGAVVRLCRDRGWLLVAPRLGAFGGVPVDEMVDALASIRPVDRSKVFLIGHSSGAAAAVAAAMRQPDRYAGVAALGGGGRTRKVAGLDRLPFFVGVGTADFALAWARDLERGLREAGATRVESKEYADIEHLAIVQVALPDVLHFFDAIARDGSR